MNIQCHVLSFNESETIHFTIKHYQQFCNHIIIYDNFSTDNTVEIAKALGCTVKTFGKPGELSDRAYIELKNECWKKKHNGKENRDWVIVCDADEILWHPHIWYTLVSQHAYFTIPTIFKTQGWNVFSYDVPREMWTDITNGYADENYSKTVIFDPKAITDIGYHIGCHVSKPKGNIIWSEEKLYLLHYRNVGGPQRLVDRHKLYRPRLSHENKIRKWGFHYMEKEHGGITDETRIKEWEEKYSKSKPLLPGTF